MTHSQPQGFLAVPPSGKGPGVMVLHAWWGLNDTMNAVCTELAESGFVAFAPDLYHGKVADNVADAETLGKALDTNHLQAKADIANAAMFLNERVGQADRGLAVIGFSLGAYYALDLAAADPEHYGFTDADGSQPNWGAHFKKDVVPQPRDDHRRAIAVLNAPPSYLHRHWLGDVGKVSWGASRIAYDKEEESF
jgi:dienelactone hydrolase